METWWDHSHNWSPAMNNNKLFGRDREGRRGGGMDLCETVLMLLSLGLVMIRCRVYGCGSRGDWSCLEGSLPSKKSGLKQGQCHLRER